ncbi:MAG: hypothetical protein KU37_05830 [Sulfuricurvum sp. PC08-66]|nr:MAG: hypothetical protein KU37_05830 [Sulfuricurvum sp. PC08-66]
MKKLLLSLSTAVALSAGDWYTATSVTAGAKYLDQLPSSFDARIEQYFIHSDFSLLYFKVGYFHEQLKAWGIGQVDTAESAQAGIGLNLITLGPIFVDAGVSGAYRFAYTTYGDESAVANYSAEGALVPYGEIGAGISLGQLTLRADFMMGLGGKVNLVDDEGNIISTKAYDQFHMNVGLAYWWY